MRPKTITIAALIGDADGFCEAQTPTGAGNLSLDGVLVADDGYIYLYPATKIQITSDGNDSGVNFVITGRDADGENQTETIAGPNSTSKVTTKKWSEITSIAISGAGTGNITIGLPSETTWISAAAAVGGAGNLTLGGYFATSGVAYADIPRHVSITSSGDDSGRTFIVTGTDRYDKALTETITGPNTTTVKGSKNFKTVTQIAVDAACAGNISAGFADEWETQVIPVEYYTEKITIGMYLASGASLTWALQHTLDNMFANGWLEDTARWWNDLTGQTTSQDGTYEGPFRGVRIAISGYVVGPATLQIVTPRYR